MKVLRVILKLVSVSFCSLFQCCIVNKSFEDHGQCNYLIKHSRLKTNIFGEVNGQAYSAIECGLALEVHINTRLSVHQTYG
ncbi:hypothetical protein Q3G72_025964 [Acer saccharum]|nr:hypothetical protein Q3G72_025964 [Acer saccharum]